VTPFLAYFAYLVHRGISPVAGQAMIVARERESFSQFPIASITSFDFVTKSERCPKVRQIWHLRGATTH
jgi:hypothetical protein